MFFPSAPPKDYEHRKERGYDFLEWLRDVYVVDY